jgi:hypothetical protein
MATKEEHLASLERQWPGAGILLPPELATVLRIKHHTVLQQHSDGVFPIRPVYNRSARGWGCALSDIAEYLADKLPQSHLTKKQMEEEAKPKLGRPVSKRQALKYTAFWNEVVSIMKANDKNEMEGWFPPDLPEGITEQI